MKPERKKEPEMGSVHDPFEEGDELLNHGFTTYFRQTLKELSMIKAAIDQVMVVAITDANGVITYVNSRFCELYKFRREEVIGKTHSILKSGEHSDEFYKNLWQTISSGNIFSGEIKNRGKDGTLYWAHIVIVPFVDEHGKPYRYVSLRSDITAIKNAEAEKLKLERAEAAALTAEAAVQVRDRFVSMAAHELKTPITSLQLILELLQKQCADSLAIQDLAKIEPMLRTALFQTNRLTSIVSDLLEVSRIQAGQLKLQLEKVDMGELLRALMKHSEEDFKAAGCSVQLKIEGQMSGTWDRTRLELALVNLLSNAIKYGCGKPIEVTATRGPENWVCVSVRDYGIGIPKKFQDKLFQRFERADSATQFKGTGLGLWITNQIIRAHQGRIEVDSEVDRGSTFKICLPVVNT